MLHKDLFFFQSQTDSVKDEGLESGAQSSNGDYGAKLEPGESEEKGKYLNLSSRPYPIYFNLCVLNSVIGPCLPNWDRFQITYH